MKFTTFIVLSCLCICFANAVKITTWGNVNGRLLGTKNIVLGSSPLTVQTYTFTYPQGVGSYPIHGIKHLDYKQHPVEVSFIKGDIGDRNVSIKVKSQRGHGINSSFTFFTN